MGDFRDIPFLEAQSGQFGFSLYQADTVEPQIIFGVLGVQGTKLLRLHFFVTRLRN